MKVQPYWTEERIIVAMTSWFTVTGKTPRSMEWGIATTHHPHRSTVIDVFGSWNAGVIAAGLTPTPASGRFKKCPHCGKTLKGRE